MLEFDHVAIAGETLDAASDHVTQALGAPLSQIGHHPDMGTHNRLMSLGGQDYLETIAIDPEAPGPGRPRWFALDDFSGSPRLTNWILRCDDLEAACAKWPAIGTPMDLERGPYRWRMAVPATGWLPYDGVHPALIQWLGPHPAPALAPCPIRLQRLTVQHSQAEALGAALALTDDRIAFVPGPAGLSASFDTPDGVRHI